jgi:hypothetical protein
VEMVLVLPIWEILHHLVNLVQDQEELVVDLVEHHRIILVETVDLES